AVARVHVGPRASVLGTPGSVRLPAREKGQITACTNLRGGAHQAAHLAHKADRVATERRSGRTPSVEKGREYSTWHDFCCLLGPCLGCHQDTERVTGWISVDVQRLVRVIEAIGEEASA